MIAIYRKHQRVYWSMLLVVDDFGNLIELQRMHRRQTRYTLNHALSAFLS